MVSGRYSASTWVAFWPLVLIALMMRLAIGSVAVPENSLHDPITQIAQLSVLCDTPASGGQTHHHPTDFGADTLLLGDVLAAHTLDTLGVHFALLILALVTTCWFFPPICGPPLRRASSLYAQGPPHII